MKEKEIPEELIKEAKRLTGFNLIKPVEMFSDDLGKEREQHLGYTKGDKIVVNNREFRDDIKETKESNIIHELMHAILEQNEIDKLIDEDEHEDIVKDAEHYWLEGGEGLAPSMAQFHDEKSTGQLARERFKIDKLKLLSSGGSDRDVYDLDDAVLKIAKSARGLYQNEFEGVMDLVPALLERGVNYVVVEKADEPDEETLDLLKILRCFSERQYQNKNKKLIKIMKAFGFKDFLEYDLLWGDFVARRNWGDIDGKPVLLDAGTLAGEAMIDAYDGIKNLEIAEYKDIHDASKDLKEEQKDKDDETMY